MNEKTNVLKVYGAEFQHAPVTIIGNRNALILLWCLLREAFNSPNWKEESFTETDGEGYTVMVRMLDKPVNSPEWQKLPLHYSGDLNSWTREQNEAFQKILNEDGTQNGN